MFMAILIVHRKILPYLTFANSFDTVVLLLQIYIFLICLQNSKRKSVTDYQIGSFQETRGIRFGGMSVRLQWYKRLVYSKSTQTITYCNSCNVSSSTVKTHEESTFKSSN